MKRILMISPGVLPVPAVRGGAVETLMETILRHNAKSREYQIDLIGRSHPRIEKDQYKNTTLHLYQSFLFARGADRLVYYFYEWVLKDWRSMFHANRFQAKGYRRLIEKTLRNNACDYILVENNMSLLGAVRACLGEEEYSRKCVFHMHSNYIDAPAAVPDMLACRMIIAVSAYVKDVLVNKYGFPAEMIRVLRNGVALEPFQTSGEENIRQKYGLQENDFVFLYAGRISPEKGLLELVNSFASVKDSGAKLLVAGGCFPAKKNVYAQKVIKAAQGNPNIVFCGAVGYANMPSYYKAADALALPTTTGEAGSLTLIEGMSAGLRIVATDKGAIPEYAGGHAVLVPPGDAFVEGLAKALCDTLRRGRMPEGERDAIREHVKQYSDAVFYQNFTKLL